MRRQSIGQHGAIVGTVLLASCATSGALPLAPVLDYTAAADCDATVDLANALKFDPEAKGSKSMMRRRTLDITQDMQFAPCLMRDDGIAVPYSVFRIPEGFDGSVVSAGSDIDVNSQFASDVTTLDANGDIVREFGAKDYRRTGSRYGVQFRPAEQETYVLIKADPALIGQGERTVETSISSQSVTLAVGTAVGSGTNTVGHTTGYSRVFSYDGFAGLRVTYPKQDRS